MDDVDQWFSSILWRTLQQKKFWDPPTLPYSHKELNSSYASPRPVHDIRLRPENVIRLSCFWIQWLYDVGKLPSLQKTINSQHPILLHLSQCQSSHWHQRGQHWYERVQMSGVHLQILILLKSMQLLLCFTIPHRPLFILSKEDCPQRTQMHIIRHRASIVKNIPANTNYKFTSL